MKTLAVATDLSVRADRAVGRAMALAAELGATLHVFSVVDTDLPQDIGETLVRQTETKLDQLCASQPDQEAAKWQRTVLRGPVDEALTKAATDLDVDLMILGLHRHRPLMDLIRETTMERLVRSLHRPVLIARDLPGGPYARILGALDFAPASAMALQVAQTLAPNAKLHAVHAVHIPRQALTGAPGIVGEMPPLVSADPFLNEAELQKTAWCADYPDLAAATEITIKEGSVHAVMSEARAKIDPDLITLGTHGRALPVPWLMGSFANDIMRDPPCDVLIVPPAGAAQKS